MKIKPPPSYEELLEFSDSVLNSLSAHIAILDRDGVILETNRAWKEFAVENHIQIRPDMVGVNYLELCDSVKGNSTSDAGEVADGIREVIAGRAEEFVVDYACHSPSEKRWFYMRATRLSGPGPLKIVVSHENITALKLAEEALKKREKELEIQAQNLDEVNTALKVLLKRRDDDKKDLEERILSNVKELIFPYIKKMQSTRLEPDQQEYLNILEFHLNDIISPFLHQITSKHLHLTPQEIQVAHLIKSGRTTKEIADILNVSASAVDFHRKNLRKKLGLIHKRVNLRSYLLSFNE